MKRAFLMLGVAATATLACSRGPAATPATSLSFQRFVSVLSELESAQPHQREAILKKHGTKDVEIREFVIAYARDPTALAAAFDSVGRLVERSRAQTP